MSDNAVISDLTEAGLAPGEGVRKILAGPENADLFEQSSTVHVQLMGRGRQPIGYRGGRKKGSKNRATREVIEYARKVNTDPILSLGAITSMSVAQVKASMGFTKMAQAADFWLKCTVHYNDIINPRSVVADLLKAQIESGVQPVIGFMALTAPGAGAQAGAAAPDAIGNAGQPLPVRTPIEIDQSNQIDSDDDAGGVA